MGTRFCFVILLVLAFSISRAQLVPGFSATPSEGCAPIRVLFTDLSTGSPDRWLWDLGNGVTSTLKDPSTTYFTPGLYDIKLTIYKGTDSATITRNTYIKVNAIPQAKFGSTARTGCLPHAVRFFDSSTVASGNIASWTWDFGDGNLSNLQNPVHTYTTTGTYRITLTVRSSDGCINSTSIDNYITVSPTIKADFNAAVPPSCKAPVVVSFSDNSTGAGIVSWSWEFGDGFTSSIQNPAHTYNSAGSFDVRLIIRNSSGCADTIDKRSLINVGNLNASYTIGTGPFCTGDPVVITNTSGVIDSTIWTFSDGFTATQNDISRSFATPGSYSFSMVIWRNGCSDTAIGNITIVGKATASFSYSPATSCQVPVTVSFQNTTPGGTVLQWDFGNGTVSALQNPTVTYTSYGSYTVTMRVQHAGGCIETISRPAAVVIQQPAITSIGGLPYEGCAPYSTTFNPTVVTIDSIISWNWNFGDGTTANIEKPFKSFATSGLFNVRLTITTTSGCTSTYSDSVKIYAKPTAAFAVSPMMVCPSDTVMFSDLSTGPKTRWFWEFGDGGTSTIQNPTWQYNDTGWMNVRLIVTNVFCADTLLVNRQVYVRPPIALFADSFVCANQFQRFFDNQSIGATSWKWFFGDGDSSIIEHPIHTYSDTGSYTVKLMVADSLCRHETSLQLRVLDEEANIELQNDGGCNTSQYRYVARGAKTNPTNITRYEWVINNGAPIITSTNELQQTYNDTATVQVRLVITDLNGCTDTTTRTFSITAFKTIANFGPINQTACVGSLVPFADSTKISVGNSIVSWNWNFGTGNDSVFTSGPFGKIYNQAGVYDVRLIVEDARGCKDTLIRPAAVTVLESIANFIASDTLVCLNSPITFTNLSVGANGTTSSLKYKWNFGNGQIDSIANPVINYATAGTYSVQLSLMDVFGCQDTLLRPLYITIADAKANFAMSDSFSSCPPLLVSFANSSINNRTNNWDFGNGNNSNLINPSHTYTQPGIFNVKLVVTGNGGCTDSLTKRVVIQGPSGVFSYSPLIGCPPLQVSFTSNTINTRFYTWDYSDGQSDLTASPTATHSYLIPGNYIPRVILEDGLGCKLPVQGLDTIKVVGAKAFIKQLASYNYCDSVTINFIDSSIATDPIVRYRWRFGDGTESSLANPSHTYTQPGRYNIILEVWTQNNCYSNDTLLAPVVIATSPAIDYTRDSTVCVPSFVQFTGTWNNPDTSTVSYVWNFGNGQTSTMIVPPAVLYTLPGVYDVSMTATNNYGCQSIVMKPLNVFDTPRVEASPFAFLCQGASQTITATGALTYQWDPHPSLSCTNCANPSARPASDYIYRVTGTDINGCQSSDTLLIKVKIPGNLSIGQGDTICVGESVQLRSNGFEILRWSPASSLNNANIPNPVARPTTTTRYVITGTDSLNCFTDSGFIDVIVYPIPQFNIAETIIKANYGSAVPLRTQSSNDVSRWTWTPAAGLNCADCAEPVATITKKQVYTAIATNAGGCIAKDEVAVEPYCTADNVFIPNTFSPNGDGQNDVFFPRGTGFTSIKSMLIFNRWGEVVFERKDFALNDVSAGWNGSYKGKPLTPDVYVYVVEVVCANNEVFGLKGNVTLLR